MTEFSVAVLGCLNFLKLCKIKYYNFCLFHSVQVFHFIVATVPSRQNPVKKRYSSVPRCSDADETRPACSRRQYGTYQKIAVLHRSLI